MLLKPVILWLLNCFDVCCYHRCLLCVMCDLSAFTSVQPRHNSLMDVWLSAVGDARHYEINLWHDGKVHLPLHAGWCSEGTRGELLSGYHHVFMDYIFTQVPFNIISILCRNRSEVSFLRIHIFISFDHISSDTLGLPRGIRIFSTPPQINHFTSVTLISCVANILPSHISSIID